MKKILTIAALALLTLGGCNKNNEKEETPPHAASTQTWKFGDQIWSDAIQIPACNKSDFDDSVITYEPDCFCATKGSTTWYYYNWPYVYENQGAMCPTPWRVPSKDDLLILTENVSADVLTQAWGFNAIDDSGLTDYGDMWSSSDALDDSYDLNWLWAYSMLWTQGQHGVTRSAMWGALPVRCVR